MTSSTFAPQPLSIGNLRLPVPVVLAPMAGITNTAFRRLCREYGQGLFVTEMITTRGLVAEQAATLRLITHHASETPRSIQLYGVDPATVAKAVKYLAERDLADHIDLNFGCPVPKVTRHGGGAALPWKLDLFTALVAGAVKAAGDIPLTIKMRKGIDAQHLTFLPAAKRAVDCGVAAIALHGRTAAEFYSGKADWQAIAELKAEITAVPVLGNGDIWSGADAARMMRETGCDGVVVGRGCLGRPWLFGDLQRTFGGEAREQLAPAAPTLGYVLDVMRRHIGLLTEFYGGDEGHACRDFRKHIAWYLKGYGVGGNLRREFALISSLGDFNAIAAQLDPQLPYPGDSAEGQRGRAGSPRQPKLPAGWLDSQDSAQIDFVNLQAAERDDSGG